MRNTENADEIGQVGGAQSQTLRLPSTERIQGFKTGSEAILPFTAASKHACCLRLLRGCGLQIKPPQ